MKELLDFILKSLVGKDNYEIDEKVEGEVTTYIVKPKPDYMGRIIGKGGAVIKAISDVVRIKAKLLDKTVYINVSDN